MTELQPKVNVRTTTLWLALPVFSWSRGLVMNGSFYSYFNSRPGYCTNNVSAMSTN